MMHYTIQAQSRIVHSTSVTHAYNGSFFFGWTEARRLFQRGCIGALSANECGEPQQASWNWALRILCGSGLELQTRYFARLLAWRKFPGRSSAGADFLR